MSFDLKLLPKESICPIFTAMDGANAIVTQYAAHALATNGAAGYGKVEYTVYDANNAVATDASGQLLNRIPARCLTAGGGVFYLTIYAGMLLDGDYTVQGWYAVADDDNDGLGWRGIKIPGFTVKELTVEADPPNIP